MTSTRIDTNPSSIHPYQRDRDDELEEPPGTQALAATVTSTELISAAARIDSAAPQTVRVPTPRARSRARSTAHPAGRGQRARVDLSRARVLVVYDLALGLERGRPEDILADETVEAVACGIAEALQPQVAEVRLVPVWDDLLTGLRPYSPSDWVVFNLCESLAGRAFTEPLVPRDLSRLGFRHTGSSYEALRLSGDKAKTKYLARSLGLTTPRFRVFRTGEERPIRLQFPLIVKPGAEGGSFGVRSESVARDPAELWPQVHNSAKT